MTRPEGSTEKKNPAKKKCRGGATEKEEEEEREYELGHGKDVVRKEG